MLCGDEILAVVVDIGSSTTKYGTAGEDSPRHVFHSDIGVNVDDSSKKYFDTSLRLTSPLMHIQQQLIGNSQHDINWDTTEALLSYGFEHMRLPVDAKYPVMYAESNFKSLKDKAKLAELTFESFECAGMYISPTAVLSSFSVGKTSSIVIDLGACKTHVSCIYEGFELKKTIQCMKQGGNWLDENIHNILTQHNIHLKPFYMNNTTIMNNNNKNIKKYSSTFQQYHMNEITKDLKKWFCCIPSQKILLNSTKIDVINSMNIPVYVLPDGTRICASEELCTIPELLFTYSDTINNSTSSTSSNIIDIHPHMNLTNVVFECLAKCDVDIRKEVISNVLLVGGGALIDGIGLRLVEELSDIVPGSYKPKLISLVPIEKMYASWIGGSILSICGSFQQMWVSKLEYEEQGASNVTKKFCL